MPRASLPRLAALTALALLVGARPLRAQTDTAAARDSIVVTARIRIIGVFDEETGTPLQDVDIADRVTGLSVRTTATGTAALFFTDTGGTVITLRKVGYRPITMAVSNSAADSTPITATLLRMGHTLRTMVTVGDRAVWLSKRDTVRTLIRNGFYARRLTSAAPSTAFITGDRIAGTLLVSNARYFGRGICESNLYIDGVHVGVPLRTGRFLEEGVDALVQPFDVAGIETYTTGELSAGASHTTAGAGMMDISGSMAASAVANASGTMGQSGCVTFIWLKQ
ncbi:MAG TPA: hypothetical protein VFT41_10580 [Gemmatimonadaceae bacterium]|nr:hypothetical protein [Gemmatimonadaceae bacterium]